MSPRQQAAAILGRQQAAALRATLAPRMRKLLLFCLLTLTLPTLAINITDARLLSDPAISPRQIAFAYANDLWVANPDGSDVKRLTSHPGVEAGPGDLPGRLLTSIPGLSIFATASLLGPLTPGGPQLLTSRPLQGLG